MSFLGSTLDKILMVGVLVIANSWRGTWKSLLLELENGIFLGCALQGI